MAIWKEIRKALNSTLGTANFKSLDKIIKDEIDGQRSLAASDNVMTVLANNLYLYEVSIKVPKYFIPLKSGSVRVMLTTRTGSSGNNTTFRVRIENYMGEVASKEVTFGGTPNESYIDIPIMANTAYHIYLDRISSYDDLYFDVRIGASVVDSSLIQVGG